MAIPVLLTTPEAIEEEIERLEIHYLASPEGELHFALLSDWVDAGTEHTGADGPLLEAATRGVTRLNRLYGPAPRRPLPAPPPSADMEAIHSNNGWVGSANGANFTN